jgi:hypothetical protein
MEEKILNILYDELKKEKLCVENVDILNFKHLFDKIEINVLEKVSEKFPVTIISHLRNILKDEKIDLDDFDDILKILKELYTSINDLHNQKNTKIPLKDLIDATVVIINIILMVCVKDENRKQNLIKIVQVSQSFLFFTLPEISIFCKCCN